MAQNKSVINVMPYPESVEIQEGIFRLDTLFTVATNDSNMERLNENATRFIRRLSGRTGLFFDQNFVENHSFKNSKLKISVNRAGELRLAENEAYELKVAHDQIQINAESDLGAMHALETLLQLLDADTESYFFPSLTIKDKPRFAWRGLMIDASRHFMPVDVIKRNLDGMAAVKLNVFHWHLSDDQGFRVESKVYPKLHLMGSDGQYYTQEQIKEIVAYARMRGIRVVPEFDVPGHASSWLVGYPQLGSLPGPYKIERTWGIFPNAMNPASEYTYAFLDNFFAEMVTLFPDKFFHIGGDEVKRGDKHKESQWNQNKEIVKFKKEQGIEDNSALQNYFNQRLLKILDNYGKTMIGWDEILHDSMPDNIVIQSWRGKEAMINAAKRGVRSLLSNGYYIDLIYPASDHYLNDPLPPDVDLSEEQQQLILGGEATMWAEYISPETIDSRIWPRTAAIAERFWSPGNVNNVEDMYRRLEYINYQLEEHGLTHIKNQDMMLRRLTMNQDIDALRTFISAIEPLKGYKRGSKRKYFSYSPLTRVVDAATPDSRVAREFNSTVDLFLNNRDQNARKRIEEQLHIWKDNHQKLVTVIDNAPVLKEIKPLSEILAELSELGLQAVESLRQNNTRSFSKHESLFEAARESYGQTELVIVTSIEKLLKAASAEN